MVKKKKIKTTKNGDMSLNQALGVLGFLGSGKTMFSGMNLNVGIGQKAIVKGSAVNIKGHEPAPKFATLSDGSKISLVGKNKGLRYK